MTSILRSDALALMIGGAVLISMAGCTDDAEPDPGDEEAQGSEVATSTEALSSFITSTFYYIRAKHSGKCLHQHGGTYNNGDPITQWDCVDYPNVQWEIETSPDPSYYFLRVRHSGKCLHQHGGTYNNGDPITQWDCVNSSNVKWRMNEEPGGYYHIQVQHSGKCLHVHGGGSNNGAPITQWDCVNAPNVLWWLDPVGH